MMLSADVAVGKEMAKDMTFGYTCRYYNNNLYSPLNSLSSVSSASWGGVWLSTAALYSRKNRTTRWTKASMWRLSEAVIATKLSG